MAMYELEERIYFDGGLPADIAEVQEDTSEQNLENNDTPENNNESGNTDNSENVSIAPEPPSSGDSGDNTENNSDNEQDSEASVNPSHDSTSNELVHQSLDDAGAIEPDNLAAIIDSIDDLTITDDILSDQNFVIASSDNENLDEIIDSLNDNTTLITYNSDDTFDSIIQKLKEELGDSKAVNIGILDTNFTEQLKVNSEKCTEFLDELKNIQYFDGEINLLCTADAVNSDTTSPEFTVSTLSTDLNGDWTTAEDSDNDDLAEYFSTDSDFLSTDNQELSTNHEVVFINSSVMNSEEIVDDLPDNAEVVYLHSGHDGIQEISDYLSDKSDIDTMRIISHGNEGYFVLSGQIVDNNYLIENSDLITSWGNHLSENADIMLYGCNLAASAEGQDLVQHIADLTGADVAASTHSTGGVEDTFINHEGHETHEDLIFDNLSYKSNDPNMSYSVSASWTLDFSIGAIESSQLDIHDYEYHLNNQLVNTASDNDGSGSGDSGTLRYCISNVGVGEEITFADDYTITLSNGYLNITKSMTITGNGVGSTVIDGGHVSGVFNIDAAGVTVELSNLTIQNGLNDFGGGIYVNNTASLTLTSVDVSLNTCSDIYGGGIYVGADSTVVIDNSTIENNETDQFGGGICTAGTLTVTNSTICNNVGNSSGVGGGICALTGSNVIITNSTVSGNIVTSIGGGIAINGATVVITDTTITANNGGTGGGGIYNAGTLSISNSLISGNNADDGSGGGIMNDNAGVTISNSTIYGNTAGSDGGGIAASGDSPFVTITDTTIAANGAGVAGNGGGIYFDSAVGGTLTLSNSIIATNTQGDLYITGSATLEGDGCNVVKYINDTSLLTATDIYYGVFNPFAPAESWVTDNGDISLDNQTLDLADVFDDNGGFTETVAVTGSGFLTTAQAYGYTTNQTDQRGYYRTTGAVTRGAYQYNGVVAKIGEATSWTGGENTYSTIQDALDDAASGNTIVLASTSILMSSAEMAANGIAVEKAVTITGEEDDSTSTTVRVTDPGNTNSRVFNINAVGETVTIENMTIKGGDISALPGSSGYGGAISVTFGDASINNVTVSNSKAYNGGGIFVNSGTEATIVSSTISSNSATNNGGGIYSSGTLTVDSTTISSNSAETGGGGIFINSGTANIGTSSILTGNSAVSGGGIIVNSTGTLTLDSSTLSYNTASTDATGGGGILNLNSLTVTSSTFTNNSASSGTGGGIINYSGTATLSVESSTFSSNSAVNGGGISNYLGTATLESSTFNSNSATTNGGGIANSSGALTVKSSTFNDNSAASGGGIYQQGSTLTVTSSTFSGNSATTCGGVYVKNATAYLLNSIVINNSGTNSDIYNDGSTVYAYYSWYFDTGGIISTQASAPNVTTAYTEGDLGPLQDNGGLTYTMALSSTAPGYQQGCYVYHNETDGFYFVDTNGYSRQLTDWESSPDVNPSDKITVDQRGVTITGTPSIGSYTLEAPAETYYMARASGNWSSYDTVWFTSATESTDPDDYTTQATEAPDADNSVGIIIYDDIAVTITTDSGNFSIDQTTINSGASITVNDNVTLTIADDGTAATDLDAAGSIIVDKDSSAGTLLIASGAAVDSNGTFTVNGELSFDDSGDNDGTLTLAGASITIAALTAGSGTISYDGAVTQSVSALTYNNLTVSGGGDNIKNLAAGTTTVSNNLTVADSTEFAVGAQTLNLTGTSATTDINGELSISTGTVDADGIFDATNGTIDFSDAGNLKLGGATITSLGSLDISKGTVWYDSEGAQAVLADSYYGLKIYGSGTKSIASGTITVNGDFTVSAEGENDVTFSVLDSTTVQVAHTSTISESLEIAGTGEFESNGDFNATGGAVTFDDAGTLYIVDTVTSLGILSGEDGTVCYSNSDAGQEIFSDTYNCNLTLTGGAKTISDDLAVDGNLNVNLTGSTTSFDTDSYSVEVTGNTTVTSGKLTVTSGSFTTTGTTDIHGTLQVNTGTYTADGNTEFSSGTLRIVSGNYISNSDFDATGGTIDFVEEGNLKLNGATVTSLGALDTSHGNVWYSRGGTQTVLADDYYSLKIDGSGTKTLALGTTRIYGDLTVSAGTLDVGANTLNVANNTDIDGTLSIGSGTVDTEGVFDATNGTIDFSDVGNLKLGGATITSLGTLSTDHGTVWYDRAETQTVLADTYYNLKISGSGTKSLGGTVNVSNDLTVSGGTLSVGAETLNVTGNSAIDSGKTLSISTGTVDANGTFDATGATIDFTDAGTLKLGGAAVTSLGTLSSDYGTVWYDRADSQTVLADTYYGLRISGGSNSTKTLGGAVDVNGDLTIDASTILDTDSANSYAVNVAGSWANNGTFNANSGTVTFDGSETSVISGTTTFNNFTCTIAGKTLTFATGDGNLQTIEGTFTLTGSDGNNIILNSDSTGIQAEISVTNFSVSYVAVQDSNNSSGTDIEASNSTDNDNNTGWSFVVSSYYMAKFTGNWSSYNTVWFTSATESTDPDDYTTQATEAPDADNSIGIIINDDIAVTITTDSGDFSIDQTTIDSGASITVNDDVTLTVADDGTAATDLNAAGSIIVDNDSSAGTLLIASGAAVDSNGTFTVNGELSFDDSGDNNGTLTLANTSITIASLTAGAGTITYEGAVSQSVSALTYYNLTISGGGSNIKTLNAGTTIVANNLIVDASTELAVGAQTLNLTGTSATTDINGELSISTGTVDSDGTFDATGGTIDFTDAGNLKLGGENINCLGSLNISKGTVWYDREGAQTILSDTYYNLRISGGSDSTKTLGGAVDVNGDLTIDASTIFDTDNSNSYAVNVAGNWTKNGTFNANSGTVTFDGSADQALSGNNTFYNLTINNSSSDEEVTVTGSLTVTNCLTITDGTFVSASTYEDVIIEEGGSLVLDDNVTVSGNWTNEGTFTSGDNNVTFDGAGAQTITASGTGGFSSLTYSGTGSLNLSGTVTVTDLTIDPGTAVNLGDSTLSLGGTASIGEGATIDVSEGTIDYTGTDQTILGTTYKNLSFTGSGTNEIGGNITVTGTFEIDSGVTVIASGYTLTYGATATLKYSGSEEMDTTDFEFPDNNGPFNLEIANTAGVTLHEAKTIAGDLTIDEGGVLNLTTHELTVTGTTTMESGSLLNITDANWSSGAFTANGGTVDYKGTAQDIFGYSYFNLTLSGSGMRTLSADLTVQNDLLTGIDVIFDSNDKNLNIGGDWTNSGSFTAGSGMVTYNGTDQNIADINYTHLTVSGAGTKTASTGLSVSNDLMVAEESTLDVNGSFSLNGTLDNSGTIQAASTVSLPGDTTVGGTFIYDGSDQTIAQTLSYNNLTISGTGTKTIAADETITVSGTFTLDGSLNLETGTGGIAGTTTLNLNGTVTDSSGTFTSGDNSLVSYGGADQTVIDGTYYDVSFSGSGTKTLGGNITVNNGFTLNGADVTVAVGSKTLTVSGDMNVSLGSVTIGNGGEIKLAGAENDLGTFTAGTGSTVEYNGTTAQTVLAETYYNLVIDNGNTNAKTLAGDITVNGDLTIAEDAKLDVSSNNCEISLKGDFSNSGAFTARAGTVTLNGTAEQQINGNGDNNAFYNLDLSNSSGALLTGNLSVGNELILSSGLLTLGAYRLTLNSDATIGGTPFSSKMIVTNSTGKLRKKFSGNGSFLFPIGTNSSTAQYTPVTVLFNSGISSEKYVDVRVVNSKEPNNTSTTNYLNRYWMVDTNATGFNADITCKYLQSDVVGTENQIYFGEYVNSSWTKYNPANTSNHTITGNGLTSFCNITGINNASPTPTPTPTPTRPDVNNGEMINDGTQTQTYTSWRTSIDNGASDSIDSDEGFEPNEVEGIGLMLQSLITFDVSVESVANGEYGLGTGSGKLDSGISHDGEHGLNTDTSLMVNGEYGVGKSDGIEEEFNTQFEGIVDLSFNFDIEDALLNHEAIAAYNEKHPLFKTELDLLLEKI